MKKLLEDCHNTDDTFRILKFCSWENAVFSSTVLSELLWQVAYSYTYELRPYLDLLLQMLMLEDSWQSHRIHNALKGNAFVKQRLVYAFSIAFLFQAFQTTVMVCLTRFSALKAITKSEPTSASRC